MAALIALAVPRINTSRPSLDDLSSAVAAATAALAASPGVEGVQQSYISDHLASATWFDWRPEGDATVVQRVDVDVAESGWWVDPANDPPSVGVNVTTTIRVLVEDTLYEASQTPGADGSWAMLDSRVAPHGALALGIAMLTEEDWALELGTVEDGNIAYTEDPDEGRTWTLTAAYLDGTLWQRWHIGPDGKLASWSFELRDVDDRDARLADGSTAGEIAFVATSEPEPINAPDTSAKPSTATLGLPSDFPMDAP